MKKKILSVLMCAAMVASMAACGLQSPTTPSTSSAASAAQQSKETQESKPEASGDAVTLVYAEVNPLDTMLGGGGTIQMSRISAFALTSYGGQKSKLVSLLHSLTARFPRRLRTRFWTS